MKQLLRTLFILSENTYLTLHQDNVVVKQEERTLASIPLRSLDAILCFSYKGASPALMGACCEFGVQLSFFKPTGRYLCSVLGEHQRNIILRKEQFAISSAPEMALPYAQSFITGKIYNARWVVERTKRDHELRVNVERLQHTSATLQKLLTSLKDCESIDQLRGVEGLAAHEYFATFDDLILRDKEHFYFTERSRRPPLDPMNALLSFIYVLLQSSCASALHGVGLDPYAGFMHTDRPGRASLSLDVMEELRPCFADRFALTLVNTGAIQYKHFETQENGSVLLTEQGRKTVLTAWEKRKQETITHPFLQEKIPWGLLPYTQALLLARTIRGDLDVYPPFLWK